MRKITLKGSLGDKAVHPDDPWRPVCLAKCPPASRVRLLARAKKTARTCAGASFKFSSPPYKKLKIELKNNRIFKADLKNPRSKILLFKNIFNSADKEKNKWFSPGALYLASSLKKSGFRVITSASKISLEKNEFITEKEELGKILKNNPDLNFIGISLCEDFFVKAKKLVAFLRKRTKAFIGVGGIMPTLTPEQVFIHLPGINFLVRGAGDETFPRLVKILDGLYIDSQLEEKQINELLDLKGFLFQNNRIFIAGLLNQVNKLENFDRSFIDFSFLDRENLTEGLNLFSSRGCFSKCFFCTTPGRGEYLGKSLKGLKEILGNYYLRLKEIYGDSIPHFAFKLSFNDDDFLADIQRAKSFFVYLKKQPFRINFFQTGVNSFFQRAKNRYGNVINRDLFRRLSPSLFSAGKNNIYIGTENFSDEELKRLNKGYDFKKIKEVIKILSEKKICHVHHFIASNQLTSPENILDNLLKISIFKILYGEYFNILTPIIPYLVSLYPSISYKISRAHGRERFLNIRGVLSIKNHPEYDYPLVNNDIPINAVTRQIVPVLNKLFLVEKDYLKILDTILLYLLLLQIKQPSKKKEIQLLLKNYKDYPDIIFKRAHYKIENDRNNLQLMITRRCHLRCRYCPVVKRDKDIEEKVLFRAVDLLFSSSREHLRLDFTGGEPLLRFDLIRKAVEYAKGLAREKNKLISFYLVTNLIPLTEEMADFFAAEDFSLELSLDGAEKFHNLYKISNKPKINAYRLTTSQLNKIFSRKINNFAVMVVTPATARYLNQNFYHLLKLGFRQIGINYALGSIWRKSDQTTFFRQMNYLKKRYHPLIEGGVIKLNNLGSRREPAILNSEIMVDVDGKVHFLTDWLFEKEPKRIQPLGEIQEFKSLNQIPMTKFLALNRLLDCYSSPSIRNLIINNIEMGSLTGEYFFAKWKKK